MDTCKYKNLSLERILEVIDRQKTCKVATESCGIVEVNPMWYDVEGDEEGDIIFHLIYMSEGNIIKNLKNNKKITIFIERSTYCYETIVAKGVAYIIENYKEKMEIVNKFKEKYYSLTICDEIEPTFIKIVIESISGRKFCK